MSVFPLPTPLFKNFYKIYLTNFPILVIFRNKIQWYGQQSQYCEAITTIDFPEFFIASNIVLWVDHILFIHKWPLLVFIYCPLEVITATSFSIQDFVWTKVFRVFLVRSGIDWSYGNSLPFICCYWRNVYSFAHFWIGWFLLLSCKNSLHILDTGPLYDEWLTNNSSFYCCVNVDILDVPYFLNSLWMVLTEKIIASLASRLVQECVGEKERKQSYVSPEMRFRVDAIA